MYGEGCMQLAHPSQPLVVVHSSQQRFRGERDGAYRHALRVDDDVQAVTTAEHQLPLQLRPVRSIASIQNLLHTQMHRQPDA